MFSVAVNNEWAELIIKLNDSPLGIIHQQRQILGRKTQPQQKLLRILWKTDSFCRTDCRKKLGCLECFCTGCQKCKRLTRIYKSNGRKSNVGFIFLLYECRICILFFWPASMFWGSCFSFSPCYTGRSVDNGLTHSHWGLGGHLIQSVSLKIFDF